jgi:hypothetical protein
MRGGDWRGFWGVLFTEEIQIFLHLVMFLKEDVIITKTKLCVAAEMVS